MRTIEFRAWDKKDKIMLFNFVLDYSKGELYSKMPIDGACGWNKDFWDVELMQFTGLKDKNGKEIYEGDIVAFDESVMSDVGEDKPNYIEKRSDKGFIYADGKRGERKYGREIKIVEWKEKSCGFEPFSDSEDNCGHCGGGDTPKGCEVIGNIHENPELLVTPTK